MNAKKFSDAMNELDEKDIEETLRFLYKGIIINHNKNRANLH